jgi:SAM-dependent methyltransferase
VSETYWDAVGPAIPSDQAEQYTSQRLVERVIGARRSLRVLDLGAGDGRAVDLFRQLDPTIVYRGVDIELSPEVSSRKRTDAMFDVYDGVNLPYESESFDIVYSHQVFEHVLSPGPLIRGIRRVLKKSGHFVGSVSQLEPYHSYSVWNFTSYGFQRILAANGMQLTELRPGIDGVSLILRSESNRKDFFRRFFGETSPLHARILRRGRKAGMNVKQLNHRMLQYSGHICFVATPSGEWVAGDGLGPGA